MSALPPEVTKKIHDEIVADTAKKFRTKARLNRVSKELSIVGHSDVTDFLPTSTLEKYIPDVIELRKKGITRAIKRIEINRTTRTDKDGGETVSENFKFELHAKLDAVGQEIDIMGIKSAQKIEVDHGIRGLSDDQLDSLIKNLLGSNGNSAE